jgi:hypothetical protein
MNDPFETRLAALERDRGSEGTPAPAKAEVPKPLQFIESLTIVDRESGTMIPFKLWPAQKKMLKAMVASDRLVMVKARQLGVSWLELALMLFYASFEPAMLFLVCRQSLEEAREAVARLRLMNRSVPEQWRQEATTDNVESIAFANGSRIRALSSTKRLGRGLAARFVLADELAFWDSPEEQLAALEPGAERLHVVSTGAGAHDFFHSLWLKSLSNEGRWVGQFYPWTAHPGRKGDWYKKNVLEAPSPALAKREYAAKPEDAFMSPAGVFFERFDSTRNVQTVEIVPTWSTFRGIDWGRHHPACVWVQVAPSGQLFVVKELTPENTSTAEFISAIQAMDATLGLAQPPRASYCDPAGGAVNVQTSTSEVELARRAGLHPASRPTLIRDGCTRMMDAIADPDLPLVISTACPWLIEAFSTIKPDRIHEDVYDERSPYDHALDALRYFVANHRVRPMAHGPNAVGGLGPTTRDRRGF